MNTAGDPRNPGPLREKDVHAPADPEEAPARSPLVLVTLLAASTLTVMAGATIAPLLPAMQERFAGAANADLLVRLVLTVPALLIAVCAPVAGVLVDRVGRKPVLLASVVLYALAGGSGLVLGNLYAILAGRALLGVAVAGVMTSAIALIADYYSGEARARVLGLQAAFVGFGGVVFLTFGGLLAGVGWRLPFLIYLVALLLAPLVALVLSEPAGARSPSPGGGPSEGLEGAAPTPFLMLAVIYALAFVGMIVFYLIPTQLPFYLRDLSGVGAAGSGLAIALSTLVAGTVSLGYRRIKARLGYGTVAVLTFFLMGVGYGFVGLAGGLGPVLAGLVVGGAGVGLLMPNLSTWLTSCAPVALRGRALGGMTTAIFLGQFLSPVASQPVAGDKVS